MGRHGKSLYFAYGSNLDPDQMLERCLDSIFKTFAFFPNHRLVFNKPSTRWEGKVADIVFEADSVVWGAVWEISETDLRNLDYFEGVHLETGYAARQKVVVYQGKKELCAWAYFVKNKGSAGRPSSRYLSAIIQGARSAGLPEEYIARLEKSISVS